MTTIRKIKSTLSENYGFSNENVTGTVSVTKDTETGELTQISGQVYGKNTDGTQGNYIGVFNGSTLNNEIVYSTSQMNYHNHSLVIALANELETQLIIND